MTCVPSTINSSSNFDLMKVIMWYGEISHDHKSFIVIMYTFVISMCAYIFAHMYTSMITFLNRPRIHLSYDFWVCSKTFHAETTDQGQVYFQINLTLWRRLVSLNIHQWLPLLINNWWTSSCKWNKWPHSEHPCSTILLDNCWKVIYY